MGRDNLFVPRAPNKLFVLFFFLNLPAYIYYAFFPLFNLTSRWESLYTSLKEEDGVTVAAVRYAAAVSIFFLLLFTSLCLLWKKEFFPVDSGDMPTSFPLKTIWLFLLFFRISISFVFVRLRRFWFKSSGSSIFGNRCNRLGYYQREPLSVFFFGIATKFPGNFERA